MSANLTETTETEQKVKNEISTKVSKVDSEFKVTKEAILQDNSKIEKEAVEVGHTPVFILFDTEDILYETRYELSTAFDKDTYIEMTLKQDFILGRKHFTDYYDIPPVLEAIEKCKQPPLIIIYGDILTSTQTILESKPLKPLLQKYRPLCLAALQSKARGRGKNRWDSQFGGLTFSWAFNIPSKMASQLAFVQYVVALAMIEAVSKLPRENSDTAIDFRIKWPNDLYHSGKKLGGLLTKADMDVDSGDFTVVAGLGLNVSNKPVLSRKTSNVEAVLGRAVTREEVLTAFLPIFDSRLATFQEEGFGPMKEAYLSYWLHTGQRVRVGKDEVECTVRGLSDSGALLAEDDSGQVFQLSPDGNSFDFFHGLISKKVV